MDTPGIEPYKQGMIAGDPFLHVSPIAFRVVAVLDLRVENRQLKILSTRSRSAVHGSVWEFVVTEEHVELGGQVNCVSYLGFGEALGSGQVAVGRTVTVHGNTIGCVSGFDETHAPNHVNIVVHAEKAMTGREMELALGQILVVS